jgi:Asp-tRNA(Asn)/Glu-tRNA(Gln) amidotransferase A subunit family amidase
LNCGIYGFKPTNERWTMRGHEKIGYGAWNIFGCGGPLGLCVDDLQKLVGCVSSQTKMTAMNFHDGNPPFDFSDAKVETEKKSIKKFGYITEFDSFPVGPTNQRALHETVENLRKAGYAVEAVKWDNVEAVLKAYRVSAALSQKTRIGAIHGEKPIPEFYLINKVSTSPVWLKKIAIFVLRLVGQPRLADMIEGSFVENRKEYWTVMDAQFFKAWDFTNMLKEKGIDALLMPGGCFAPMEHGNSGRLALGWCYTYVLNATDFPCGAIPVTTVKEGEDCYPANQHGNDYFNKFFDKNAKNSVGLPVGIQVTCPPYQDEKVIAAMKILEEVIPKEFEMPLMEVKK